MLTENWMMKLLSLVFALVLWFFVMGEQDLEKGFAIPVELANLPEGLIVSNDVPSLLDVRISGPRSVLMNLEQSDLAIDIDLDGLGTGVASFKRLEERFNLSRNLKITRTSPSVIEVRLERIRSKRVSVKVVMGEDLPAGFEIAEIAVKPTHVEISGAGSELKLVNDVQTDPIPLAEVQEDFVQTVSLDYAGKFTALKDDKTVEVTVSVKSVQ